MQTPYALCTLIYSNRKCALPTLRHYIYMHNVDSSSKLNRRCIITGHRGIAFPDLDRPSSAMASLMAKLRGGSDAETDPDVQHERDKYRLLVTAGPQYDRSTHKIVKVNTEVPTIIENEFMVAKIVVRVHGFRGLPAGSPSTSTEYFSNPMHSRDQYSLGFSFVPKQDIPSVDTVWGNDFDHPVRDRIPPGNRAKLSMFQQF